MAYKGYAARFPVRKLNRKRDFKKRHGHLIPQVRVAGRKNKGISRRGG